MLKPISFYLLCSLLLLTCALEKVNSQSTVVKIDQYVEHIIKRHGIPGVALAVIKDGQILHQNKYGNANLEHGVPITDASIFRVYSLTKPFISIGLFQLIEQEKIDLEDNITQYVDNLPKTWINIKIKHLLTHSSGLPDMAPIPEFQDLTEEKAKQKVFAQNLHFSPGERYEYNQTNFWLLHRIIEKLSNQKLPDFIINNQFSSSPDTVFFSSDSRDIVKNRVTPYFPFSKPNMIIDHSYLQGDYGYAMNGLNITMEEFIKWDARLRKGELLKEKTQEKMLETYSYKASDKLFAYGWDKQMVNGHRSYGFSGSLVTAYRIFPDDDLSIIFLSNGLSYFYNIDNIVNHIASIVDEGITDNNNLIYETLLQASMKEKLNSFKEVYTQLSKDRNYTNINFEAQINAVGYMLMNIRDFDKAIDIFKFNSEQFPDSWNTYDSLGEAYESVGNKEKALYSYRKALDLNTTNQYNHNATLKERIERLEKE